MNHSDHLLENAREHVRELRLEASLNRELQSLKPRLNLRCRLARVLRNLAANLEPETTKSATSS